jgi:Tfp pilus assembly protein PilX
MKKLRAEQGVATLIITLTLLILASLIMIFAANFEIMQEKSSANYMRNIQAFNAAEAGLEYGISYFQVNASTILANPSNGYISSTPIPALTNVSMANGASYSVIYSNPIANNYNLITITSTGTSIDTSAVRIVSQQVQFGSVLLSPANSTLLSQGAITISGNSTIKNTSSTSTILSGSTVALSGSSTTVLASGTSSTSSVLKSDVQTNNTTLSNLSQTDYFATYFGSTPSLVKNQMGTIYSNSTSTDYSSSLKGVTGKSIWIDQTGGIATVTGNTTIGSAANPVLIVVNGDLKLSGNITIYGYIFVFGNNTYESIAGNVNVTGSLASAGPLSISGNTTITYSPTVLSSLKNLSTMKYYAKVPGSWKDF